MILQGHKTIEVRSWQTEYRGDLLICSSAKPDDFLTLRPTIVHPKYGTWCDATESNDPYDAEGWYKFGQALLIADLYEIVPMTTDHEMDACCECSPGYYSWMLRNVRHITPFPVKGQLKIFDVIFRT
jgi:hypothetical protein